MGRVFYPHETRLAEARPDILASKYRLGGIYGDDAPFPGNNENVGPAVIRDTLMFLHTSAIEQEEADAVLLGIRNLLCEIQSKIKVAYWGNMTVGNGNMVMGPDQYQELAEMNRERGFGKQVNLNKLNHFLWLGSAQILPAHFATLLLDQDLTTAFLNNDFVYGMVKYPYNILSVRRLKGRFEDEHTYRSALGIISAQQTARMMGLSRRNFNHPDLFHLEGYCNGESGSCLMEPLDINGRNMEKQVEILSARTNLLCADCLQEAEFRRNDLRQKSVIW
jgi:hypothetical protein